MSTPDPQPPMRAPIAFERAEVEIAAYRRGLLRGAQVIVETAHGGMVVIVSDAVEAIRTEADTPGEP